MATLPCNATVGRNSPGECDAPDIAHGTGSGHRGRPGRHSRRGLGGAAERRRAAEETADRKRGRRRARHSPYLYNLAQTEQGPLRGDHTYRVRDRDLGAVRATYRAMGAAADYIDMTGAYRPLGNAVYFGSLDTVAVPGERTEYYSGGDTAWDHTVSSSFPWGELMTDLQRAYAKGSQRAESWYDGVVGPVAARDAAGTATLAAERQGNQTGFFSAMWGDSGHYAMPGSFGDVGELVLKRDGAEIGSGWYPNAGVFDVPAEPGTYELTRTLEKFGAPARDWQRSQGVRTTWTFRSGLDASAYSTPLPIVFPALTLPEDGLKAVSARAGQRIGLGLTGHAGYAPGALKSAALSYSYDNEHWTQAPVARQGDRWSAVVDHTGAAGKPVSLKVELTDVNGATVTQMVGRAYDIR
ncbi:hypothetical protein [Streptomyces sp. G-G2]|uniref:hypothetical protein n=1 Tax=Streptomyces sp. G-G2 TaxID=3046201 RepID=UPI0024B87B27|nr:hypothetical protein [Streptomyces sp. G-G2]MDJ0383671.1 hypothetical protein [Streptomyces sp. G-G2]